MTRLAVLGLHHETNTFSSVLADLAAYNSGGIHSGEAFVAHYRDSQATFGGYFETAAGQDDVVTVSLRDASVNPCGLVTREAYEEVAGEMSASSPSRGHSTECCSACMARVWPMVTRSADADLADWTRSVVGPDVPIGSVLDMHANADPRLAGTLDVLLAYQTNPHVDARRKAAECRALLLEVTRTGNRPAIVVEQLPLVVTVTAQDTGMAPMSDLLAIAAHAETEPGVIDVSILEGFPYADVPQMGMAVLVSHSDEAAAREVAQRVGAAIWDRRADLQGSAVTVAQAVTTLAAHDGAKPLLVLDVGDNIGGGGPGDSTVLLAALQAAPRRRDGRHALRSCRGRRAQCCGGRRSGCRHRGGPHGRAGWPARSGPRDGCRSPLRDGMRPTVTRTAGSGTSTAATWSLSLPMEGDDAAHQQAGTHSHARTAAGRGPEPGVLPRHHRQGSQRAPGGLCRDMRREC